MAWRTGSFPRSLVSAARAQSLRQTPQFPRLRPPPATSPLLQPRPFSFVAPRNLRVLGCTQSLLPLHDMITAACLTSHLTANARACCELSHGRTGTMQSLSIIQWQEIVKLMYLMKPVESAQQCNKSIGAVDTGGKLAGSL